MSPEQYALYWEHAAIRHKSILHTSEEKHFCTYGVEAVLSELKDVVSPLIALEDPEYRTVDSLSDNVMLQMTGGVLVLKKCIQGDWAEAEAAKNEMFSIAFDMVTKLQNDRRKAMDSGQSEPENLIKHLVLGSIELIPVGPVFDGCYGWRINHTINTNRTDKLDASKWNDETAWQM